jgi:hypothetical protein
MRNIPECFFSGRIDLGGFAIAREFVSKSTEGARFHEQSVKFPG